MIHFESDLIKRILGGEKQLFAKLIDVYQKSIYNLVYRMTGNREDALDLTQETFLRAFKNLHQYDHDRPFSPWIHRIASNLCIDYCKKQKIQTIPLTFTDKDGVVIEYSISDLEHEPASHIIAKEVEQELFQAMLNLPEKFRLPLILRHLHDYSYEEIAGVLNVPQGTVKSWIYRGRAQLKEFFQHKLQYKEEDGR